MNPTYDILGLGCAAVDELLYIPAYPPADSKARILRRQRECGGLTATALVAAARLGGRCAYAAVLGHEPLSQFVCESLQAAGIDLTHVVRHPDAYPVHAIIVVGEQTGTRNIFYDNSGRTGADDDLPDADIIRRSRVLFVDQYGMAGNLRAAKIARDASIPVVGDFEDPRTPRLDELLGYIGHLIVSEETAAALTGQSDSASAVQRLASLRRQATVVTCGNQGCWFIGADDPSPHHQPAFKVNVVDTTGCGDVFHGAYAWALARSLELPQRVRIASAAAAVKATRAGGQRGAPDLKTVEAFLERQKESGM